MFTDKPIFYGAWGELFDDIKETLIPFHKMKGLTFCNNPQILKQSLIKFFSDKNIGNCDRNIRDREIENFFYKADGRSSERLFKVLEEVYNDFYNRENFSLNFIINYFYNINRIIYKFLIKKIKKV